MLIGRVVGATHELGAPKDWDESKGKCLTLPVRAEMTAAGQRMTSAWLPTPEEIEAIVAGAPVLLSIYCTRPSAGDDLGRRQTGANLMSRNFGVRRNCFGAELFDRFWHDNDNEPKPRWPVYVVMAAVIIIVAVGMFV